MELSPFFENGKKFASFRISGNVLVLISGVARFPLLGAKKGVVRGKRALKGVARMRRPNRLRKPGR